MPPSPASCITCKSRKVKCDRQHPHCRRCRVGGFTCQGYSSKFRFVSTDATRNYRPLIPVVSRPVDLLPKHLNLFGEQHDVFVNYTLQTVFLKNRPLRNHRTETWFELASRSQDGAVSVLCLAFFAKQHGIPSLTKVAIMKYGLALRDLHRKLQDPVLVKDDDTLRDTMAMVMYELIVVTTSNAWLKHADGMARLFMLRGAKSFRSEVALDIFCINRALIVMQCMLERRPCFLSQPEWLSEPWALGRCPKTALIGIHDILCVVPDLLSIAERLAKTPDPSQAKVLYNRLQAVLGELFRWKVHWLIAHGNSLKLEPTKIVSGSGFPTITTPNAVLFNNLEDANANELWAATFIVLFRLGLTVFGLCFNATPAYDELDQSLLEQIPSNSPLPAPTRDVDHVSVATELCSMVEYHFRSDHRDIATFDLMYPFRMVLMALEVGSVLREQVRELLFWIKDVEGYGVGPDLIAQSSSL